MKFQNNPVNPDRLFHYLTWTQIRQSGYCCYIHAGFKHFLGYFHIFPRKNTEKHFNIPCIEVSFQSF
ncbi:MAG: hypothetical protein VSS75_019820 [Candidatus Parabeggiatoa sp.]|nr:hypothetical protein [Candidatus Parabeggiatoa sp.]